MSEDVKVSVQAFLDQCGMVQDVLQDLRAKIPDASILSLWIESGYSADKAFVRVHLYEDPNTQEGGVEWFKKMTELPLEIEYQKLENSNYSTKVIGKCQLYNGTQFEFFAYRT